MLNIGWLSTGRGEGSRGLLKFVQDRIASGRLDARIRYVFSNRAAGEAEGSDSFFELVRSYDLPLLTYSSRDFRRASGGRFSDHREEFDRQVERLVEGYSVDLCMLAGYMLIVGPTLWKQWPMLNLHPALPDGPVGTWQEVIWSLIERSASHTGAMVHLANDDLDRGPVATYLRLPITGPAFEQEWAQVGGMPDAELKEVYGEDLPLFQIRGMPVAELKQVYGEDLPLFQKIRAEEYRREPYLIAETLQALSEGRLALRESQVMGPDGVLSEGLCLDREIEAALSPGQS